MADRDPIATLDKLAQALDKRVGDILWDTLTQGRNWLEAQAPLKKRTMKGSLFHAKPIQLQGNILWGGLFMSPKWGAAFIGRGQTTIKPQGGKFLAIPLDAARLAKPGASAKGLSPRNFTGLVTFDGIMWGKAAWGNRGTKEFVRQRRAAGEKINKQTLVPMFALKGSVVLQKRIDPAAVPAYMKPLYLTKLKEACLLDNL